ncbi:MAG: mechanosensitive ion channel family protein [Planctomycetota bacterium]
MSIPAPDPDTLAEALTVENASETISQTLISIWESFLGHLPLLIAGILVLIATGVLSSVGRRVLRVFLGRTSFRDSLKELFERLLAFTVWAVGLLLAAMVVFPGVQPGDAIAALGVGSIAIGLAFRDIFENFFAGVLILWNFPFENGDFIACQGHEGRVVSVTVRNTVIETVEGVLVVLPNATIYKNAVDVLTHRDDRRVTITAGVAYGEDVGEARQVIRDAVDGCLSVRKGRPIEVFAQAFGSSSIDFEVTWWTGATPLEIRKSRDEVVEAVKRGLDEAGIEIPFPYRTLTFKDDSPVRVERGEADQG